MYNGLRNPQAITLKQISLQHKSSSPLHIQDLNQIHIQSCVTKIRILLGKLCLIRHCTFGDLLFVFPTFPNDNNALDAREPQWPIALLRYASHCAQSSLSPQFGTLRTLRTNSAVLKRGLCDGRERLTRQCHKRIHPVENVNGLWLQTLKNSLYWLHN